MRLRKLIIQIYQISFRMINFRNGFVREETVFEEDLGGSDVFQDFGDVEAFIHFGFAF